MALGQALRFAAISAVCWAIAALLFTALNVPNTGWDTLVVGGAILLGGETTSAVGYLLAERITRPVTVLALAGGPPPSRSAPGVAARLTMAWSLGTGVPLLGILVVATMGLAIEGEDPARLAGAVAFLSALGLSVGWIVITIASRSIAGPIGAVRTAMARVEVGELDVAVPVDDGSEVGLLEAGFNRMAGDLRERERLRDLFGRHVGREVAAAALENEGEVALGGEQRELAAVFVDLIGSTQMASRRPPQEVVALLNRFFRLVVEVVEEHGGWVNKFEGDAALCVFGAPIARPDAAGDALRAARTLGERIESELEGADGGHRRLGRPGGGGQRGLARALRVHGRRRPGQRGGAPVRAGAARGAAGARLRRGAGPRRAGRGRALGGGRGTAAARSRRAHRLGHPAGCEP